MAIPFRSNLDLGGNQLQSALLEVLSADPGSGPEGRVIYNSTDKTLKVYNGTTWVTFYLSNVRLDQVAAPTASVSLNSQKLINVATPTAANDAANKSYVDNAIQGLSPKQAVRAASTANVSVSAPGAAIDGVTLTTGDRVLLKNQTAPAENGIYIWSSAGGAMARAADMDAWAEVPGALVTVLQGSTNADTAWLSTADPGGTLGTTAVPWVQFGAATTIQGGNGLTLTGNTLDVNVDGSSIEINADILRVKALGITTAMLAAGAADLTSKVTGVLPLANGGLGVDASSAGGKTTARANIGAVTKYAADITGNAAATTFNVTHNLATTDVHVTVWEASTNARVLTDVVRVDSNTVQIGFSVAPVNGKVYRVVVVG